MRPEEHQRMAELEWQHWWFVGTRRVLLAEARRCLGPALAGHARILDLGCGTGYTSHLLHSLGRVTALDRSAFALRLLRPRAPAAVPVQADAARLPFAAGSFDLICAFDVLEHLPDDHAALREILRCLAPGGTLLLTVPAHPWLWSGHDEALSHHRRYRRSELRAALAGAGFALERLGFYNSLLFAPVAGLRLLQRLPRGRSTAVGEGSRAAVSDLRPLPGLLNRALAGVLGAERHLLRHVDLPIGLSLLAVAHAERA